MRAQNKTTPASCLGSSDPWDPPWGTLWGCAEKFTWGILRVGDPPLVTFQFRLDGFA